MPKISEIPEKIRPYVHHGLDLQHREGEKEALCECPFCGREGKFSINVNTGLFRCFVCSEGTDKGGGNVYVFLRRLYELSRDLAKEVTETAEFGELTRTKKLLYNSSIAAWGLCKSSLTMEWLVPGYNEAGKIVQLYKYYDNGKRWLWLPTPTLKHGLLGMNLFDSEKQEIYLCEGIWDAIALWETMGQCKDAGTELVRTGNLESSLLADANVLALPGCEVWQPGWRELFAGKRVALIAQNDHDREHNGKPIPSASYKGMKRISKELSGSANPPHSIKVLVWGAETYDPELPSGYDIRDKLAGS